MVLPPSFSECQEILPAIISSYLLDLFCYQAFQNAKKYYQPSSPVIFCMDLFCHQAFQNAKKYHQPSSPVIYWICSETKLFRMICSATKLFRIPRSVTCQHL
jgi:hypothetical protein